METNAPYRDTSSRIRLAGLAALCMAVAAIGAAVTAPAVQGWYQTLNRPSFTPPDGVFAPVWTCLYLLMSLAAWRAWKSEGFAWNSPCLRLFLLQLAFNLAWSILFFGLREIGWALLDIVVLEACIAATVLSFYRRDRLAGLLMLPYLAWVGFALLLNLAFLLENP